MLNKNACNLKMLMAAVFFLTGLVDPCVGQSQSGKQASGIMPNIMPVSPEASSLGKYGEWPVSYYTGTTNISIPIYQIESGEFVLPVQLSYHTGGVKIDEIPSWVGTNWTLNAGGAITRSTVGLPDEDDNGFLTRNLRGQFLKTNYDLYDGNDYVALKRISENTIDTEPDLFFYNFAGQSGKFYFDKEGNFQAIPVNSLKVLNSPIKNPQIAYWEIADQNGNVFYFGTGYTGSNGGGLEFSSTFTRPQSGGSSSALENISAWYLTKIVLKNNADVIYLDYNDKTESYKAPPVYSYKILDYSGLGPVEYDHAELTATIADYKTSLKLESILRNGVVNSSDSYSPTAINIFGKSQLSKIRWNNGEVNLESLIDRQDIIGKNLTKISVLNNTREKLKEVRFYYSYFNERYYIDSLVEYGALSSRKSSHKFLYESPELLPKKHNNSQDHWGYYNQSGNQHLLPFNPVFKSSLLNANRNPDQNYMKFGILKQIVYPTGGVTNFQYEANVYRSDEVVGGGDPDQPYVGASLTVGASEPQSSDYKRIADFVIARDNEPVTAVLNFKNYGKPPRKDAGVLPIVMIQKLIGDTYQTVASWDAYDNTPSIPVANSNGLYDFEITKNINLGSATYRIVTDLKPETFGLGDPPAIWPEVKVYFKYTTRSSQIGGGIAPGVPAYATGGGLRIKEVSNSIDGTVIGRKQYAYQDGQLLLFPKYIHEYGEEVTYLFTPGICTHFIARYKEITSSSQAVLGFTQGSPVGYKYVIEKNVSPLGDDIGYNTYNYSFAPDELNLITHNSNFWPDQNIQNKTFPLNSNEYKRGLLLEKEVFKRKSDNSYVRIFHQSNRYEFNDGNLSKRFNSLKALRVKKMIDMNYSCGPVFDGIRVFDRSYLCFAYSFYNIFTGWVQTRYTQETTYDQNGENPVVSKTDFNYANPLHLQVTSTVTTNSAGKTDIQESLYPHEMVSSVRDPNGIYQSMVAKNIISPVVEQKRNNNGIVSLNRTNYYQPYPNMFVPQSVEKLNDVSGLMEVILRYYDYNEKGNVVSLSQENGPKITYLWSYNGKYPVAEIKNSDYAAVRSILGQTAIDAFLNSNPDKAAVDNLINPLRTGLPNTQINSISYKSLIGITSQTDAKGQITYCEYDNFQRLLNIKDQHGNIVKSYKYHFKN